MTRDQFAEIVAHRQMDCYANGHDTDMAAALTLALRHIDELLAHLDTILVVETVGDVGKVDGSLPYARVPQGMLAKLLGGANLAVLHLEALASYRAAINLVADPEHSGTVSRRQKDCLDLEVRSRLAHGLPAHPK